MTLAPLLNASPAIHLHVFGVVVAIIATALIFTRARGTGQHRLFGWVWVTGMGLAAVSSFFIHSTEGIAGFSAIHLISVYVLVSLVVGLRAIRKHRNIRAHRSTMLGMTIGGLGVAGALSFLPGRIMSQMLFAF
ncbi:MAG: DUF2306 domain-containing protein [Paracoccaceae bacterium]